MDVVKLMRDERGMTTAAMALSLMLSLSLVFSLGQMQRVYAVSSKVQNVADVCALASLNPVAEFMTVVRACDAVVLSLSLGSAAATGLGVVVGCVPFAAPASEALLSAGRTLARARDGFSQRAQAGLEKAQRFLPFAAAAQALSVASQNGGAGERYVAVAVLTPSDGSAVVVADADAQDEALREAESSMPDLEDVVARAQQAREKAQAAKDEAFAHDCGNAPGYCMQERADSLAQLPPAQNPTFSSVDAWSFSVALSRAQAYYPRRLAAERPADDSVKEQAKSALRKRFYSYAANKVGQGYVFEGSSSVDLFFPLLPQDTKEMRLTSLYTDEVYPYGQRGSAVVMHAWEGCPNAQGCTALGSIWQMERDGFAECELCEFSAESMGSVTSASSHIQNGFEYHYLAVARAARAYQAAVEEGGPALEEARGIAGEAIGSVGEAVASACAGRVSVVPPGAYGAVVVAANLSDESVAGSFANGFADDMGPLGCRVAVAGATLVADPTGEGESVLAALLDSVVQSQSAVGSVAGVADAALTCWSDLLHGYSQGHDGLLSAVENGLDSLPLVGDVGLGRWAADALRDVVSAAQLQPANTDALRPVLVNSAHVAAADDSNPAFGALIRAKEQVVAYPLQSNGLFEGVMGCLEDVALERVEEAADGIVIAQIQVAPGVGEPFTVSLGLPPAVADGARGGVAEAFAWLRRLQGDVAGERPWE